MLGMRLSEGVRLQAPSPVGSAVQSLAARLQTETPTPALAAQLLATQDLLSTALQVCSRTAPDAALLQSLPCIQPSCIMMRGGSDQCGQAITHNASPLRLTA